MKLELDKGYFLTYLDGQLYGVESIMWQSKTVVLQHPRTNNILPVSFDDLDNIQWVSL